MKWTLCAMVCVALSGALLPAAAQAQDPAIPAYADETASSGLTHSFTGEWTFMVGGGAAAFDCNGDGILTGKVIRPILWGPGKANAVQEFAADNKIDLEQSYFYADGDEDVATAQRAGAVAVREGGHRALVPSGARPHKHPPCGSAIAAPGLAHPCPVRC